MYLDLQSGQTENLGGGCHTVSSEKTTHFMNWGTTKKQATTAAVLLRTKKAYSPLQLYCKRENNEKFTEGSEDGTLNTLSSSMELSKII